MLPPCGSYSASIRFSAALDPAASALPSHFTSVGFVKTIDPPLALDSYLRQNITSAAVRPRQRPVYTPGTGGLRRTRGGLDRSYAPRRYSETGTEIAYV